MGNKCCDTCPRYTNCEEDGQLSAICCKACSEFSSCNDEGRSKDADDDECADSAM